MLHLPSIAETDGQRGEEHHTACQSGVTSGRSCWASSHWLGCVTVEQAGCVSERSGAQVHTCTSSITSRTERERASDSMPGSQLQFHHQAHDSPLLLPPPSSSLLLQPEIVG